MKIVQVGAYPPPYGGVSVHLMRLHDRLRRAGLDCGIIDLSTPVKEVPGVINLSWPAAVAHLSELPRACVHFHNFAPGNAAAYERLARRHVTVLSLHDEQFGDEIESLGSLRRRVTLARLRRLERVVVDNRHCQGIARRLWGPRAEIQLIPEFIPPAEIPPLDHAEILDLRRRCRYLLASAAASVQFHRGQDLYGLDLLVDALARLVRDDGLDVGLVVLLPGGADDTHLTELRRRADSLGLDRRCLWVTRPLPESSSLWRVADVVLRATNTDGNSLTVLEALSVGVPVVASDCVERPAGTVLFSNRDAGDLAARVADVLADLPPQRERLAAIARKDNTASFLEMYRSLSEQGSAHAV